ncbi:MAG: nucleotidyltransferase family protein [Algoriphagus sp.]|uniref:nucleotidyltransferase family protein n=1 Tax=Algoriphagus sp. TaxID=1872435 RepID=UPI001796846E|nr:nucleotidyltransferase family protein [Algoriphagus sp.]NVJ86226.1 nucleotidyltransferase family protein [Algoriphagus sp.]
MNTGIILLAAGSSSRLGSPKQLVEYQGKTLIQRSIDVASKSEADSVLVVLGWQPNLIKKGIQSDGVYFVENESWEDGMTSSMQAGLAWYMVSEDKVVSPNQILIMTCDQFKVDTDLLDSLIKEKEKSGKGIIACRYSDTLGVPAIFDEKYFEDLLGLDKKVPAKKLILEYLDDVQIVDFPLGALDLDTEEDLSKLNG